MSSQLTLYDKILKFLWDGTIDFDTDTLKCALILSSYTFDAADYQFGDVSGDEVVPVASPDNGYTAGGETLAGVSITEVASPVSAVLTCNDISWTALTATFKYAVIYANVTRNGVTNPLIACIALDYESGGSIVVNGVDYQIQISTDGLLILSK